jgi:hypothetical protein
VQKWEKLSTEEREGKVRVGVLADTEEPEFTAEYRKLMERVQGE